MNGCATIGKLGIVVLLSEEEDSFFITNCHCMILLFPLQLILQSMHSQWIQYSDVCNSSVLSRK
jgi:hypothetical protein